MGYFFHSGYCPVYRFKLPLGKHKLKQILWYGGHVYSFESGEILTEATVLLEAANGSISTTTTIPISKTEPIFAFSTSDIATIGVTAGDLMTLTATSGALSAEQVIVLTEESQYVPFSLGWRCHDFDPFNDSDEGEGLPDDGQSDAVCLWGYGRLNGQPLANVQFQLEIDDATYTSNSQYQNEILCPISVLALGVKPLLKGNR